MVLGLITLVTKQGLSGFLAPKMPTVVAWMSLALQTQKLPETAQKYHVFHGFHGRFHHGKSHERLRRAVRCWAAEEVERAPLVAPGSPGGGAVAEIPSRRHYHKIIIFMINSNNNVVIL